MSDNKEKTEFEFNVMMFGGKRTGKTSVLAAMKECFDEKFKSVELTISPYDEQTNELMKKKRKEMDGYFQINDEYFECKDSPTLDKAIHSFMIQIKGKKGVIKLNFLDYPGEWVNSELHCNELAEEVKKAHVIIVAIDTPYLVEMPSAEGNKKIGIYNDKRNFPNKLAQLLKNNFSLENDSPKKMVLFVPLKCEKYYHSLKMTSVNELIKSAYGEAIQYLSRNSRYCETVILPIITLGEVDFYNFKTNQNGTIELNQNDLPTTELYKKNNANAKKAAPIYCEQPAAYILMYLLDQAKESKILKGNAFSKAIQWFYQCFQEVFMGMPAAEDFIRIREDVLNVINDEEYIHTVINDPFNFNDNGSEI